jgi:hypothetical protein
MLSVLYLFGRRLTHAVLRKPGRLAALGLTSEKEKSEQNTIEAVYRLAGIPWTGLYAASALLALILFATLGAYLPGAKMALLALPGLVWLAKRYLMFQRRRFNRQKPVGFIDAPNRIQDVLTLSHL